MAEQLTKNLLVRLIKEEIEKTQLDEIADRPPTAASVYSPKYPSEVGRDTKEDEKEGDDWFDRMFPGVSARQSDVIDTWLAKVRNGVATDEELEALKKARLDALRAKGDIDPDTRRRKKARSPRFLRRYKQYIPAFETEFGGTDKKAFRKFYSAVGMPRGRRDFVFGGGHFKYFEKYVQDLDKATPAAPAPKAAPKPEVDDRKIDAVVTRAAMEMKAAADFDDSQGVLAAMRRALRRIEQLGVKMDQATKNTFRQRMAAEAGIRAS